MRKLLASSKISKVYIFQFHQFFRETFGWTDVMPGYVEGLGMKTFAFNLFLFEGFCFWQSIDLQGTTSSTITVSSATSRSTTSTNGTTRISALMDRKWSERAQDFSCWASFVVSLKANPALWSDRMTSAMISRPLQSILVYIHCQSVFAPPTPGAKCHWFQVWNATATSAIWCIDGDQAHTTRCSSGVESEHCPSLM